MNNLTYRNVEDVFAAARKISDELSKCGQVEAAREITGTIESFWTTSSEALGETRLALLKIRPTVERYTESATLKLLDEVVKGADDLWHGR